MAPDLAAQIMAHAWANADFAAALQGEDPYGAIRAVLGVAVPPDTPLPEIPRRRPWRRRGWTCGRGSAQGLTGRSSGAMGAEGTLVSVRRRRAHGLNSSRQ
jgi:hypothetical protein